MSSSVVRGFLEEVWNQGRSEAAELFIDPRYEIPGVGRGPRATVENREAFRVAFPDLRLEVDDLVANEDRVAVWMRLSGTHLGPFRGHAATGKQATWDEVGFFVVEGDRIVRARYLADMFGLRKALGVIPADLR